MKRIMIATDLSARSDRALQRAIALAHEFEAALHIVHVVDDSLPPSILSRHEDAASEALREQIAAIPQAKDVRWSTRIIVGQDYSDIVCFGEEHQVDLVVLGIHRHSTREMFRGTTAERIVRFGRFPVLVVRDPVNGPYRRVVVPIDLSIHSRAALAIAARIAPRGDLHIVHASHAPYKGFLSRDSQRGLVREKQFRFAAFLERDIRELSAELGDAAPCFDVVQREGSVSEVIREQVARLRPDLLAMGTHGRTGIGHMVLGSVAEDLLADAPVDVLAVKAE